MVQPVVLAEGQELALQLYAQRCEPRPIRVLGHANTATTGTYLNITTAGLAESMRRFGTAPVLQVPASTPVSEHKLDRKRRAPASRQTAVN
jgi:hypothetical protein